MRKDLNPLKRTIRLMYRITKTETFLVVYEGVVLLFLLFTLYYLLTFACVGLHSQEACFN